MKMPASTKAGGVAQAMPDVCNTPSPTGPIPSPYPNIAQLNTADGVVNKVLIDSKEVVVETSTIPHSQGDEAGSQGGVTSGTDMDQVAFKQYSSKVIADGKKLVFATARTAHNGSNPNAPCGVQVAPSQAKVLIGT